MLELFRYIEQSIVPPTDDDHSINVEGPSDFQDTIRRQRDEPSGGDEMKRTAQEFITAQFADGQLL